MLDIFEKVFSGSIRYLRIDGSTAGLARQKAVDHFNGTNSEIDVMLLSTKAAGIGLTLTGKMIRNETKKTYVIISLIFRFPFVNILLPGADRAGKVLPYMLKYNIVFLLCSIFSQYLLSVIYDPSWNPAEDAQAVDRCYRIVRVKIECMCMLSSGSLIFFC